MPITPDAKDWTWVLERPCPECGFEAGSIDPAHVGALIRDNAASWQQLLRQSDGRALRDRPTDERWSPLEYACHVRDVFRLYDQRLTLMLTEDDPTYPNWDQDVTAIEQHYNEQDPKEVARELDAAAKTLAGHFDAVTGAQWERAGTRSDGARFTVDSFARYLVHDPVHHLYDVAS